MILPAETAYGDLIAHFREAALLSSIESLLGWDERCLMPEAGGEYRAEQMTLLAGLVHRQATDPRVGEWLGALSDSPLAADPHSDTGATIRELKRRYEKQTKLPQALVEELSRATVRGQQIWQAARRDDDFASFRPALDKIVRLKREQAQAIGFGDSVYDPLLDDFEPGARTADLRGVLAALREELTPLVGEIADSGRAADISLLARSYPVDVQERLGRAAAAAIGFDFARGRLDTTIHPFCSGMGPNDCRITTRYDERFFSTAFFGILHEAGHGIYDQGLSATEYGLPLGEAASLGIHESQSRMWENQVGRGRAFWKWFYPQAQQAFPVALGDAPFEAFFFAINDVRPSLIRVEADEATYNLHILVRFELELALLEGDVAVDELPGAWREKYRNYLGVAPDNDRDGVLQDIHWSAGLFGYFPTYSLGNLCAAQFFAQADADLGGLDAGFARGEFAGLRDWLRAKIHCHGQRFRAAELVERVTGSPLSHVPLVQNLRAKLGPLYGVD